MMEGYHRLFNGHALKQVIRTADMPNVALGVGEAAVMNSYPLVIRLDTPQPKVTQQQVKTLEQVSIDQQTKGVNEKDFPNTGYLGSMYGGGY